MMYNVNICDVFIDYFYCLQCNIVTLEFLLRSTPAVGEKAILDYSLDYCLFFTLPNPIFRIPKNSVIVLVLHYFSTTFLYFLDLF